MLLLLLLLDSTASTAICKCNLSGMEIVAKNNSSPFLPLLSFSFTKFIIYSP